jgi:hypothetical protein
LKNTQVRNSVFNLARTLTDRLNKTFLSPKKPYTEKAQSKAIRVIGSIADQVKTINDFIREHPYEEDRVKFLLSSVIEQLK